MGDMDDEVWAVALVDDRMPEHQEYGDYRGWVVVCNDACEAEVASREAGVHWFADFRGVQPDDIVLTRELHEYHPEYYVMRVRS